MPAWNADWAWSLPLIVLNVIIHVLGLGLINERVVRTLSGAMDRRHFTVVFTAVMGAAALLAMGPGARRLAPASTPATPVDP